MKFRALIMALISAAFIFAGCLKQPTEVTEENDSLDARIYGTWNRTATYTDGQNMATEPATTMFMEDGTYTSIGTCTVNGGYMIVDDVLNWTINDHDCKGFTGPYEYNSTFKISDDGEGLTIDTQMSGHLVTETFVRATE